MVDLGRGEGLLDHAANAGAVAGLKKPITPMRKKCIRTRCLNMTFRTKYLENGLGERNSGASTP